MTDFASEDLVTSLFIIDSSFINPHQGQDIIIFSIEEAFVVPHLCQDLFTTGSIASSFFNKFKNYGYCTIHNIQEFWITFGNPNPVPPNPAAHNIAIGTFGYLQLTTEII